MILKNRNEAGKKLAEKIMTVVNDKNVIILAVPRGGVIVGEEIAKKLNCSLDVVISKKITLVSRTLLIDGFFRGRGHDVNSFQDKKQFQLG